MSQETNKKQKTGNIECANLPMAIVSAIVMAARPPPHPCCKEINGRGELREFIRPLLQRSIDLGLSGRNITRQLHIVFSGNTFPSNAVEFNKLLGAMGVYRCKFNKLLGAMGVSRSLLLTRRAFESALQQALAGIICPLTIAVVRNMGAVVDLLDCWMPGGV